jgi:hypothetical protein
VHQIGDQTKEHSELGTTLQILWGISLNRIRLIHSSDSDTKTNPSPDNSFSIVGVHVYKEM